MAEPSSPPPDEGWIPNTRILDEIGRGAEAVVYRAVRAGRTLALKTPHAVPGELAGVEAAARLQREAAALARIHHPCVPRVVEIGDARGRPYLLTDHVEGRTLDRVLAGGPLAEPAALALARALAGALGEIHRHGLVHRDLTPHNIVLDPAGAPHLIDLGFALRAGGAAGADPAGTLRYAAPEQSGALARPVDGRADLYALGAVLFECLTGRPPFLDLDAGALIRRHAHETPPDLRAVNAGVSAGAAAIVARLLAKDPDERYQTAAGLITDIDRLPAINAALAAGQPVTLGALDTAGAPFETPLFGRQDELAQIDARWQETRRGRGGFLLVEGAPGSGKSRLIAEFLGRARADGAVVLVASCAGHGATPAGPLREALGAYVRSVQRMTVPERARAEEHLRASVDVPFAPLTARLASELAALLGAPAAPFSPDDAPDAFSDAVADFLVRFARGRPPVVLFLDDVQWLDQVSLHALQRLLTRVHQSPLFVLCAARLSEEVRARFARLAPAAAAAAPWLTLTPLDDDAIARLVAALLGEQPVAEAAVRRIASRAAGNPLVAGEYVRAMLDRGVLRPTADGWQSDDRGLEDLPLPADVLELLATRIAVLSPTTRTVLGVAAVVGYRFALDTVMSAADRPADAVHAAVVEATQARLIEREGAEYVFVHERVREALLARLSDQESRDLHQRVAEILHGHEGDDPDRVYELARHYALGRAERHPRRVYETSLAAGLRAVEGYADVEAADYLERARAAATAAGLPPDPVLDAALGDVCFRTARVEDAIAHYEAALAATIAPARRAWLRYRLSQSCTAVYETARARQEIDAAFAELRVRPPRAGPASIATGLWQGLRGLLADRTGAGYARAAGQERERLRVLACLYEQLQQAAYFDMDITTAQLAMVWPLPIAHRLGPSRELVTVYCNYANIMEALRRPGAALDYLRKAERVARELGDTPSVVRTRLYHGVSRHFTGAARAAEDLLRSCLEHDGHWLTALDYVNGASTLAWNLMLRGYTREAWDWSRRAMLKVGAHQARPVVADQDESEVLPGHVSVSYHFSLLATLGRPREARRYYEVTQASLARTPDNRYRWAQVLGHVVLYHLEQGELGESLEEAIGRHRGLGVRPNGVMLPLRHFYVFQAYARLAQRERAVAGDPAGTDERLREALDELKQAGSHPLLRCHRLVIEGAWERLHGRADAALRRLAEAEALAAVIDSPWACFELARERALLYAEQDNRGAAAREARAALLLAVEHGWPSRARAVRERFALEPGAYVSAAAGGGEDQAGRTRRHLQALLQVSRATVAVRDPHEQARRALDEVVRVLGAERGFVFLCAEDEGDLVLEAGRDSQGNDLRDLRGYSRTLVERVRLGRRPLVVSGTEEGAALGSVSAVTHGLLSIIAAPLMTGERVAGVLYLDSRATRGVFTDEDVEVVAAIAGHIAIILESARAAQLEVEVESERRQRRLAELLRDVSSALNATLDLREVLDRLLDNLALLVPNDGAAVLLRSADHFDVVAARGMAGQEPARQVIAPAAGEALFVELLRGRRPYIVGDVRAEPRFGGYAPDEVRARIGVPLFARGDVAGMLLIDSHTPHAYGERDAEIALTFAGQAMTAIENARLFEEVQRATVTDALTGMVNRRHFLALAERELERARLLHRPLSVIMLDIDGLKEVNDIYGHAVGDRVLQAVANACRDATRRLDILCRYADEEIALLLPEIDGPDARLLADRLRQRIAQGSVSTAFGPCSVTASFGVATLTGDIAELTSLLLRADAALHHAKQSGRNRVG